MATDEEIRTALEQVVDGLSNQHAGQLYVAALGIQRFDHLRAYTLTGEQATRAHLTETLAGVARDAKPEAAFKAIRDHFREFKIAAIEPILERCETRLAYFTAYGQNPAALYFNVGLRRGLEYAGNAFFRQIF